MAHASWRLEVQRPAPPDACAALLLRRDDLKREGAALQPRRDEERAAREAEAAHVQPLAALEAAASALLSIEEGARLGEALLLREAGDADAAEAKCRREKEGRVEAVLGAAEAAAARRHRHSSERAQHAAARARAAPLAVRPSGASVATSRLSPRS